MHSSKRKLMSCPLGGKMKRVPPAERCIAKTQKGTRCKKRKQSGSYCPSHIRMVARRTRMVPRERATETLYPRPSAQYRKKEQIVRRRRVPLKRLQTPKKRVMRVREIETMYPRPALKYRAKSQGKKTSKPLSQAQRSFELRKRSYGVPRRSSSSRRSSRRSEPIYVEREIVSNRPSTKYLSKKGKRFVTEVPVEYVQKEYVDYELVPPPYKERFSKTPAYIDDYDEEQYVPLDTSEEIQEEDVLQHYNARNRPLAQAARALDKVIYSDNEF